MKPAGHSASPAGHVGVLLVNLGTPDSPSPADVRRYLAEFLSDPRVIEIPPLAWKPILHGIILQTRPAKSAHAYRQIWTPEGSPLAVITSDQAQALQQRLGPQITVRWAMRYGKPAMGDVLQDMKQTGCERILLAPLYPQYCAATTASVVDCAHEALARMRWQPSLRSLPPYFDDPAYIAALADDMAIQLDRLSFLPEVLLLSFHGMPRRTHDLGDPYYCQCLKTARLLETALGRPDLRIITSFQSRFGRARWLEPASDATLQSEAQAGTRRIAVAAPGFSADCLETLEELAIRGKEQFLAAGGQDFAYLPCLNASSSGMDMLETLIHRELGGWIG
ncbi:MAG: ferrochelatase [Sphingomonadaceae bacterium]